MLSARVSRSWRSNPARPDTCHQPANFVPVFGWLSARRLAPCGVSTLVLLVLEARHRLPNRAASGLSIQPPFEFNSFVLQVLVLLEEVTHLALNVFTQIAEIPNFIEVGVLIGDGHDLVVLHPFIFHIQERDRPRRHNTAGKDGIRDDDQHIQVIAVFRAGLRDKSVVEWVVQW